MAARMRGKRARLWALAAACVTMLALAVTLVLTQRGDAPGATATGTAALPANPSVCTAHTLGVSRASNPGLAADCDTLLAIKSALRDHAEPLNWAADSALRSWRGVTLGGAPERVTGLDLSDNGLTGSIPTQLGRLTALTALDLSDNSLTGNLPTQLGGLTALTTLALSGGNAFTGCIPGPLWAAETHDLAALGRATCTDGTVGGGDAEVGFYEPVMPGTYKVPLAEMTGENKNFVFTVPSGLNIETRSIGGGGNLCDTPEACPTRLGITFNGTGVGEKDNRFWFCLDLETGAECGRGYPFTRVRGGAIDEYGYPLRCGGREGCSANDTRAAKYDPLIDQVVASAHIEAAR